MSEADTECGHDDLEYHGMDVGEPGVIYEDWTCRDCGASVVKVYEPSYGLVYPEEDGENPYKSEEVIE